MRHGVSPHPLFTHGGGLLLVACSGKEEARTEFASSELLKDVAGEMQLIIREGEVESRKVTPGQLLPF